MKCALASLLCAASLSFAPAAYAIDFGDAEIVAEGDLSAMRGGFITAGGYEIGFGATVRTFVDGQLALVSELTWSEVGAAMESQVGALGQPLSEIAEEERAIYNLPRPSNGLTGIVLSDASGVTALVHRAVDGSFQNLIINDADGRDLRQEVELTITLPGFEASQANMLLSRIGFQIADDIAAAPGQ